ncbi:amidohydrolase 2 [Hesseltinella vesiculosa]|uniref:Amidohydrolase 2 n=1 Tax=Hesseltinella vesiculosa TaxID=101127 RepID=A0A1X2GMX2_9FUNG|nr:amidohydrolase 2 [Hesseltinella vesiculosa]
MTIHPVIDAHVHFFHPSDVYIPWAKGTRFDKDLDAADYTQQVKQTGVRQCVYVEVDAEQRQGLVEAAWIRDYAEQLKHEEAYGGIGAVVAFAPMDHGDEVRHYLRLLQRLVGSDLLRGVRYLLQAPGSVERMASAAFRQGLQVLGEREFQHLHFELVIDCHRQPEQFPALIEMVQACPHTRFVLDHMAKPPCHSQPGAKAFDHWAACMDQLARCSNVVLCKVSGLLTELEDAPLQPAQLAPFVQVARDTFGIDRLCFGSDWPILELRASWQQWMDLLQTIVQSWDSRDKIKLFTTNAQIHYRLARSLAHT